MWAAQAYWCQAASHLAIHGYSSPWEDPDRRGSCRNSLHNGVITDAQLYPQISTSVFTQWTR